MGKYIEYNLYKAKKEYPCDICDKLITKDEWYIEMKLYNSANGKLIVKRMHFECRPFNRTKEETDVIL